MWEKCTQTFLHWQPLAKPDSLKPKFAIVIIFVDILRQLIIIILIIIKSKRHNQKVRHASSQIELIYGVL